MNAWQAPADSAFMLQCQASEVKQAAASPNQLKLSEGSILAASRCYKWVCVHACCALRQFGTYDELRELEQYAVQ